MLNAFQSIVKKMLSIAQVCYFTRKLSSLSNKMGNSEMLDLLFIASFKFRTYRTLEWKEFYNRYTKLNTYYTAHYQGIQFGFCDEGI